MKQIRTLFGQPVLIDGDNIDTDQIIPGPYLYKSRSEGDFGYHLFHNARYNSDGSVIETHPLNQVTQGRPSIIVGGANFGCGSSREQAAWSVADFGCVAVIAESFGNIFYQNCISLAVLPAIAEPATIASIKRIIRNGSDSPLELDLVAQTLRWGELSCRFSIGADDRRVLLEGADAIARADRHLQELEAFRAAYKSGMSWVGGSSS